MKLYEEILNDNRRKINKFPIDEIRGVYNIKEIELDRINKAKKQFLLMA